MSEEQEVTELDIQAVLDAMSELLTDTPSLERQQRSVEFVESMVSRGVPEDQALAFIFGEPTES